MLSQQPGPSGVVFNSNADHLNASPVMRPSSDHHDDDVDGQSLSQGRKSRSSQSAQLNSPLTDVGGSEESEKIFFGHSFSVYGYTEPSSEDLKQMIEDHGGRYEHIYSKTETSYMIASNVPYAKVREVGETKIIRPQFIVDCLKEKKLLPIDNYFLYGAKRRKIGQTTLSQFTNGTSNSALPDQNDTSYIAVRLKNEPVTPKAQEINNMNNERIDQWNLPSTPTLLDLQTLMGLPEIIRNEIIASYESKPVIKSEPQNNVAKTAMKNAMAKANSAAGNATKNKKGSSNQGTKTKRKNSKASSKPAALGPMDFFVVRTGMTATSNNLPLTSSTTSSTINSRPKRANICGETDLHSVTAIIREWIETELELIDEDVAYILRYFFEIMEERCFLFLAAVVQTFYEAVGTRGDDEWKNAYNNIVMSIQCDLRADPTLSQDLVLPTFDV